jgi:hypothetical protein
MVQALITKFHELRDQFPAAIDRNGDEFHSIKARLKSQFRKYDVFLFIF